MVIFSSFSNKRFWTFTAGSIILVLMFTVGCSCYRPFGSRELSWKMNAPKSNNPIFVGAYDHDYLWDVLVDVVNMHFEIEREMPVRLYGNVLTEGRLDAKPKIGASMAELWHADSVGIRERFDCTLQTIRRRVEVRVIPETGGYQIDVKVYKELEDNKRPLMASSTAANLRFEDQVDYDPNLIDVNPSVSGWYIIERDTTMEDRLLLEIVYRLKNPSGIIRKSKEPIRG